MTTAKKTGRRAADAAAAESDQDAIPESIRKLQAIAGTGEGNLIAYISRRDVGDVEDEHLDRVALDTFLEDPEGFLKERYGGGRYHIRVRDGQQYVKGGNQYLKIGGPPKDAHQSMLDDRLAKLEAKWAERIEAAEGGKAGGAELWLSLGQTLAELRSEIRRPQHDAVAGANPLELTIGLLETVGASALPLILKIMERKDERPDPMEQMESMLRVMTMMREMTGPPADGMGAIVQTLARPLAGLMEQHTANQRNGTAPPMTLPAGTTPNPPASAGAPSDTPRPAWYPMLQRAIPQLVQWAREGKDPELRASLILEDLPVEYIEPVYNELARGDAFLGEFITHVPPAADHRLWFRAFFGTIYTTVRGWIEDEGGTVPDAEPPAVWELGEGPPPDDVDEDADG